VLGGEDAPEDAGGDGDGEGRHGVERRSQRPYTVWSSALM
jgi:hypothetical protein